MLFRRLHLQLTGLCALITITILSVFSFAYLSVAEHTMLENLELTFRNQYDTLSNSLKQQQMLPHAYLLRMEQNNDCMIFLWDNGTPLSFNTLETHSAYTQMAEAFYEEYLAQAGSGTLEDAVFYASSEDFAADMLPDGVSGKDIYMGISNLSVSGMSAAERNAALKKNKGLTLLVLSPNASLHDRLVKQRVTFALLSVVGCLLLTLFSYFFTGKMIKPLRENQERQQAFVAGASHELRTPLAVILSAVSARPPRFEETIRDEARRMSRLVDELLLLSRPGEQSAFRFAPVAPDTFLINFFEQMENYVTSKGRKLSLTLPDESFSDISADAEQLRRLLEILVENAVSYTGDEGHIRLELTQNASKKQICFTVSDNGIGIPDKEKENIFERFYRAENSRTSKDHFGLGLSIAKEIVYAHKGRITVCDTQGGGSTFHCFFPLNKS